MLYGIDSRQRDKAGLIAEKNRYAPWSGAPMSGQLDCSSGGSRITLLRETRRPNAPMGHFTAQYTGTGNPVPNLTSQTCGEALLGVPREVYERSAFIRQTGLGISENAELERRILSLITTGDEETSYIEACSALKKQLNRRKHNKSGELPAAEAELAEVRRQLEELQLLNQAALQAQQEHNTLSIQIEAAKEQLFLRRQHDAGRRFAALAEAKAQTTAAQEYAERLRQELEAHRIPENTAIARLRGAIVNLESTRKALDQARSRRDKAARALLLAESAVSKTPFAGLTPEQAAKLPLNPEARPQFPIWTVMLAAAASALLVSGIFAVSQNLPAAIGGGCAAFGLIILIIGLQTSRKQRRWEAHTTEQKQQRERNLADFLPLYQTLAAAQAESDKASAAAEALYHTLSSNEQGILLEVRRFAPEAFDISAADAALQECAVRRKALSSADEAVRQAQIRQDVLAQQLQGLEPPAQISRNAPAQAEAELELELARLQEQLSVCASVVHRLSGQISAGGDSDILSARADQLETTISTLSAEYSAIELAMSTLENANAALQSRFSPSLGRRSAEIFRELTGGRYSGVVLDRSFHLSAEPTEDTVYRDAQLLSVGAADQLYLAVRLAICELVLPADEPPPLILDDALTNYDDARCVKALNWLRKEAEHRQILLFTCHSREAEFFRGDPEVQIQRLTETRRQV